MLAVCVHCTTPTRYTLLGCSMSFSIHKISQSLWRADGRDQRTNGRACFICFHLFVCPIQLLVNAVVVVVVARLLPFHFILPLCLHIESSIVYVWARHICYRFISSIPYNIALKFLVYLGKHHKNKAHTHILVHIHPYTRDQQKYLRILFKLITTMMTISIEWNHIESKRIEW